jgi:hypothetical protein
MRDERIPDRRIRHARETNDALGRIWREPTAANVAALHELHAAHLRELGDEPGAARADERAGRARQNAAAAVPVGHEEADPVAYSLTGAERADAALRRAVEGSERIDAYEARASAGRERSSAARRRVSAAGSRAAASAQRSTGDREETADDRDSAADERDRAADERERLADERDGRADLRDRTADRRERAATRPQRFGRA